MPPFFRRFCSDPAASWARAIGLAKTLFPCGWPRATLAFFLLSHVVAVHATHGNLVAFMRGYDPVRDYGGNIVRYWISPELHAVVFEIDGHSYRRDLRREITAQISQWQAMQNIMRFEPAASAQDANLVFRADTLPSPANCSMATHTDEMARTYRPGRLEPAGVVVYGITNVQQAVRCLAEQIPRDVNELLDISIQSDISHELGHVLGFDHPEELGRSNVDFERYGTRGLSEEEQDEESEVPHLMSADAGAYLREMEVFLGRPLEVADIRLSPVEMGALRLRGARLERERAQLAVPANFCMPHPPSLSRSDRSAYYECLADLRRLASAAVASVLLLNGP